MGRRITLLGVFSLVTVFIASGLSYAAPNADFSQVINAGILATDILDTGRNAVTSPSVSMSAKNFSFDCQAGGSASSGSFGSNTERIYVNNPNAANNGWTLTVAATSGTTARWANGGSTSFIDFNDPTGTTAGCNDGADTDSSAGQMTVDPSVGTLTADCATCTTANISKGSSASFSQGVLDSITILNAASSSDDIWRGYLTGATVNQTIPAETPADTFNINLTLTATAS